MHDVLGATTDPRQKHERRTLLSAIVVIFIVAYAAIALEHPIKINKGASALLGAGLLWTVYAMLSGDHALVEPQLRESAVPPLGSYFFSSEL